MYTFLETDALEVHACKTIGSEYGPSSKVAWKKLEGSVLGFVGFSQHPFALSLVQSIPQHIIRIVPSFTEEICTNK